MGSFLKKKFTPLPLGSNDEDEDKQPTISIKNATTSKTEIPTKQTSTKTSHYPFEFSPEKSKLSSPSRASPIKKKAATTRKIKTPTKKTTGSFSSRSRFSSQTKLPPPVFEREQANKLLDSIKEVDDIRYTISSLRPENMRAMIRYATDSKNNKTLTPYQEEFLQELNIKIKTENPYTRMIHEETRGVADQKINWTSKESSLPRGVIVIVHTHGGFVQSHNLIKYPTDVNEKLESVSTFYLSDIGAVTCNIREDYKQFDEKFKGSLLDSLKGGLGLSIKDVSEKAEEGLKGTKLKRVKLSVKPDLLEKYFEAGVYNLAVCTKTNNTPFLNKGYSCGKRGGEIGGYKLQSIQVVQENGLIPLSEIIGRKPEFDCQNEHSSITTFELVKELCKVIVDLEHVLVIDTSCSPFTPSIIKELFKEMPDESTPHKHRKTGLFKEMSPSPEKSRWDDVLGAKKKTKQELQREERKRKLKTIKRELEPYFDEGLKGGKKTKKRKYIRRYNKNKSIKNKNKRSRKYTKTYYMRGGATSEQIAAAVVMRPLILNLTGSKNSKQYKDLNKIIHHEGKHANFYSHEEPEYTFNYSQLAQEVIENAYDIINKNLTIPVRIKHEIEIVKNKAAASADPALALESPGASALESPGASALESPATQKKPTMLDVLSKPGRLSSFSSSTISPTLAKVLSHGNGSLF